MEFALAANDAMGNVVAIAEDDCRPGFHCELLWREGEIIPALVMKVMDPRSGTA